MFFMSIMESVEYLQTELLLRELVINFHKLKVIDSVENRKALIDKVDEFRQIIAKKQHEPVAVAVKSSESSANYII
jgi:hypothetical protein